MSSAPPARREIDPAWREFMAALGSMAETLTEFVAEYRRRHARPWKSNLHRYVR